MCNSVFLSPSAGVAGAGYPFYPVYDRLFIYTIFISFHQRIFRADLSFLILCLSFFMPLRYLLGCNVRFSAIHKFPRHRITHFTEIGENV